MKRHQRGSRSTAASGLTAERIRNEALRVIDDGGLETFSTRKLGAALGCEAMAIYWYYPSKDLLLDAVARGIMSKLSTLLHESREDQGWIDALRTFARALRKLAHEHPHAFPLLATRGFAMDGTENLVELARHEGTDDRRAAHGFHLVCSYCFGFVFDELASLRSSATTDMVSPSPFDPSHSGEVFEFGLDVILRGLSS
ncbi:MAG: TetR/AcrR family transcriptional regulator C-terminal domain-containing protein [Polyangiaceae bacterium]|nr:TetR/AcrR family transcriptional regulator C-terminal domain-containing protein [Polyangiaceae bacterium]